MAGRREQETFDMTATLAPLGTATPLPTESDIRIYVACLAAYNSGHLHGRWIDAGQGEAHIWEQTRVMLAASPEPDAEEWAIHDYEGFEGAPISEYSSFETIAEYADFISERGALGGKLLVHYGGDLEDAKTALEEYCGEFESLENYARELTEDTGGEIPEHLARYIDYAAMGRDMEMGGDVFTIETGFQNIHIFRTW
jgi:antirestriction protein